MFDLTQPETLRTVEGWIADFRAYHPDIPVILVGNKCDITFGSRLTSRIRATIEKYKVKFYPISAKTLYNQEKPFVEILRDLTGDSSVNIG